MGDITLKEINIAFRTININRPEEGQKEIIKEKFLIDAFWRRKFLVYSA